MEDSVMAALEAAGRNYRCFLVVAAFKADTLGTAKLTGLRRKVMQMEGDYRIITHNTILYINLCFFSKMT